MDWTRFANPSNLRRLDSETRSEIEEWANQVGMDPVYWERGVMSKPEDIRYWLRTKTMLESAAQDEELIEIIGRTKKIDRPVILDLDREVAVEGRHRMTAALRYGLPVPIVMISSEKTKGAARL